MPRVLPLHPRHCDGSDNDVQRYLAEGLRLDPESINRLSYISHHSYYGCQTKISNANHATALMSACMLDHPRCVQYLLDNGADANLMDAHRMPALFYAVAESSVNCVRMLCERGAYAEHLDDDGNPNNLYLLRAIDTGDAMCLQALLQHGACITTPGIAHPLARAIRIKNLVCLRVLLLHGANFEDLADPDATDYRTLPSVRLAEQNLSARVRAVATMIRLRIADPLSAACVEFGLELKENGISVFDIIREADSVDMEDLIRMEQATTRQAVSRTLSSLARSVLRSALGAENYLKKLPQLFHPTNGRRLVEAPSLRHVLMFEDLL